MVKAYFWSKMVKVQNDALDQSSVFSQIRLSNQISISDSV